MVPYVLNIYFFADDRSVSNGKMCNSITKINYYNYVGVFIYYEHNIEMLVLLKFDGLNLLCTRLSKSSITITRIRILVDIHVHVNVLYFNYRSCMKIYPTLRISFLVFCNAYLVSRILYLVFCIL